MPVSSTEVGLFTNKDDDQIVTQLADHQADILAYIHSILLDHSAIRDVLQRTNLVIWKKRAQFKQGTNFKAWAFSIARWEVKSYLKEKKRKSWLVFDDSLTEQISHSMVESSGDHEMHELRPLLIRCLSKLTNTEQELIRHRYYSEEKLSDFAQKTNRSVGSLKVSLCRIRASLKRCIQAMRATQKFTQ